MSYRIALYREAENTLDGLDRATARRIEAKIDELALDPFSPRLSRQLETAKDRRYSRVGDWRIIFRVNEADDILDIVAIKPRGKTYRK
jgi:mRNA interferase RelE/StbE